MIAGTGALTIWNASGVSRLHSAVRDVTSRMSSPERGPRYALR
jgi:hypothetical protein